MKFAPPTMSPPRPGAGDHAVFLERAVPGRECRLRRTKVQRHAGLEPRAPLLLVGQDEGAVVPREERREHRALGGKRGFQNQLNGAHAPHIGRERQMRERRTAPG
jgi:hypothetical protein